MSEELIVSVGRLCGYLKDMLAAEELLRDISVKGEISNFSLRQNHAYFTLKDDEGMIPCILFDGAALSELPANGEQVVCTGRPNFSPRHGRLNFSVSRFRVCGRGEIADRLRELKKKLSDEGLFAPERKKPLPAYAFRIGVITSPTGAVLQDIRQIAARRNPKVCLEVFPVTVQGDQAPAEIAEALGVMDARGCDVLILARGGGSEEDLGAFNTEEAARAVAACRTPVISAVGHETDFTLADFAADVRAPTPSAAAELAVFDLRQAVERCLGLLAAAAQSCGEKRRVSALTLERNVGSLSAAHISFIRLQRQKILHQSQLIAGQADRAEEERRRSVRSMLDLLEAKNPLSLLRAGYVMARKEGIPVRSAGELQEGDRLELTFADGRASAQILKKE